MINTLCLLFSLLSVSFVAVRAAMLDKTLPWFKPVPEFIAKRIRNFQPGPARPR